MDQGACLSLTAQSPLDLINMQKHTAFFWVVEQIFGICFAQT
jgi:hypothetical protein